MFTPRMLADGRGPCCTSPTALCAKCEDHHANFEPPNPYEAGIQAMRAATETPASKFEDDYKAARFRELAAEYAEVDAHLAANPSPRLTAAELNEFAPPNPYDVKETT